MMPDWMRLLSKEENNEEFSQLVHEYYKLASMRVMQFLREKYKIPKEDIPEAMMSIFARFLNESCYSIGAAFTENYTIHDVYDKQHLLNLVKVLNGEKLNMVDRDDIETDIQESLMKFKTFIENNASDFTI